MKKIALTTALIAGLFAAAAPAQAAFPVYPSPGSPSFTTYSITAGNTGFLRAIFQSKDAGNLSELGVIVNGFDRGVGLTNANSTTFGQIHNYGAINAGDSIVWYINNTDSGRTFSLNRFDNPFNIQHFWRTNYSGTDFGGTVTGGYYRVEDLTKPSDWDYNDFAFVATTGAIPEPATWAMMIMGFGLIGGALRSRKANVTTRVRFA